MIIMMMMTMIMLMTKLLRMMMMMTTMRTPRRQFDNTYTPSVAELTEALAQARASLAVCRRVIIRTGATHVMAYTGTPCRRRRHCLF